LLFGSATHTHRISTRYVVIRSEVIGVGLSAAQGPTAVPGQADL
jgi:hypothetical protein